MGTQTGGTSPPRPARMRRLEITRGLLTSPTLKLLDRAYLIYKGDVVYEGGGPEMRNDPTAREIYLGPEFNMWRQIKIKRQIRIKKTYPPVPAMSVLNLNLFLYLCT